MKAAVNEFASLASTYRLLARLWIREVDGQLLTSLLRSPLCHVFTEAGGTLPPGATSSTLEELAVDYCQLFLGPANHLPPFQSVWQRGQFQSESAESMRSYVSILGYEPGDLMVDHLGVQLDVMGGLLDFALGAVEHSDDVFDLPATYFAKHLAWMDSLLETSIKRAKTDFYRSTIGMTRDFLCSEEIMWAGTRP
ncbi:MAG: molecular chaperone TorD family protein [Fuerstiella sp.]|nr:molecular chaperone TorD family protein [Fuerstiella sp.]